LGYLVRHIVERSKLRIRNSVEQPPVNLPHGATVMHQPFLPRLKRKSKSASVRDPSHEPRVVEEGGESSDLGVVESSIFCRRRFTTVFDGFGGVEEPREMRREEGSDGFARCCDEVFRLRRMVRIE
jgi:hypothetical protein